MREWLNSSQLQSTCIHTFHAKLFYLGMVLETEGHDRSDINLPGSQLQLLQDSASSASGELLMRNSLLTAHNNYFFYII